MLQSNIREMYVFEVFPMSIATKNRERKRTFDSQNKKIHIYKLFQIDSGGKLKNIILPRLKHAFAQNKAS